MDGVYNLHQHTRCAIIYIGETDVTCALCYTTNRVFKRIDYRGGKKTCITYNKEKTNILNWGNPSFLQDYTNYTHINDFKNKLYQTFKKEKNQRNEDDQFLFKAVSDYLVLQMKDMTEDLVMSIESMDIIHYVLVVPSEWEEDIREDIFRPIFIQSGLISKDDSMDRLLFFSDLECIFFYLQNTSIAMKKGPTEFFKRRQNVVMCKVTPSSGNSISVGLTLVEAEYSLFDSTESVYFPRVVRASTVSVKSDRVLNDIQLFLKDHLIFKEVEDNQSKVIQAITTYIYDSIEELMEEYFEEESKRYVGLQVPFIKHTSQWKLNETQTQFIKSLCIFDICAFIGKDILESTKDIISDSFRKDCTFFAFGDEFSTNRNLNRSLFYWLEAMFEYTMFYLSHIITPKEINMKVNIFDSDEMIKGAGVNVFEAIQNSDMHTEPCLLTGKALNSSSVFIDSKPNAIMNINITLHSTSLSYSIVNDNGIIKKTYENDHFMSGYYLPPLKLFYKISNVTVLNISQRFIVFVGKYLENTLNHCSIKESFVEKTRELALEFKTILNINDDKIVTTQQQKYINAFIFMYLICIKEIVSNQLPNNGQEIRIGYIVSIEKFLLDGVVGTMENLKKLIIQSGIADKSYERLNIITQGEEVLPTIQNYFGFCLPLKSYFVLAQLHENYIQLTLHQVGVASSSKEDGNTIVLRDEIIPIPNIYDSLCLYMWNHIIRYTHLIQLCEQHDKKGQDISDKIFSLKNKSEFFKNLKEYMSNNIFSKDSNLKTKDKKVICLGHICTCGINVLPQDIIDIALKPVLDSFVSITSGSLVNSSLFGKYNNIDRLIGLIYFNHNPQLQPIIKKILDEEAEDFNETQETETRCITVKELPNKFSKAIEEKKAFMYQNFVVGDLYQISSESYGFFMRQSTGDHSKNPLYKNKRTDTVAIKCEKFIFSLLEKGDIIPNYGLDKIFYVKKQSDSEEEHVTLAIAFPSFNTFNGFGDSGYIPLEENMFQILDFLYLPMEGFEKGSDVPIMISMRSQGFSSSFEFSVKIIGEDVEDNEEESNYIRVGEPLTLTRF